MGLIGYPETPLTDYQYKQHNIPEDRQSRNTPRLMPLKEETAGSSCRLLYVKKFDKSSLDSDMPFSVFLAYMTSAATAKLIDITLFWRICNKLCQKNLILSSVASLESKCYTTCKNDRT
jgi:hypothetical protein